VELKNQQRKTWKRIFVASLIFTNPLTRQLCFVNGLQVRQLLQQKDTDFVLFGKCPALNFSTTATTKMATTKDWKKEVQLTDKEADVIWNKGTER
jgi:hypothetical protein